MPLQEHHIGLLSFKLTYTGREPAFEDIQANVYELDWEKCIRPLDKIFSTVSLPDIITVVDKLSVVVKVNAKADLEMELVNNLPGLVENALRGVLPNKLSPDTTGTAALSITPANLFITPSQNTSPATLSLPVQEYVFNTWFYFLEKGLLPQVSSQPAFDMIYFEAAVLKMAEKKMPLLLSFFRASSVRALLCKRLVRQFSTSFIHRFFEQLLLLAGKGNHYEQSIALKVSEIRSFIKTTEDWYSVLFFLTAPVIEQKRLTDHGGANAKKIITGSDPVAGTSPSVDEKNIQHYLESLITITGSDHSDLSAVTNGNNNKDIRGDISFSVPAGNNNDTSPDDVIISDDADRNKNKTIGIKDQHGAGDESIDPQKIPDFVFTVPDDKSGIYYPDNAGLILLHPYIEIFLEAIGCMYDHDFINEEAKEKSVQALHYLCTGKTNAPEYCMLLEKTLCNMDFHQPLPGPNLLEEKDCKEADQLLQSFIGHWNKLGNISIDALRETFLQRKGKLNLNGSMIHLQIETKGADVLLNYLPFGISVIHLPWLDRKIQTGWEYYSL